MALDAEPGEAPVAVRASERERSHREQPDRDAADLRVVATPARPPNGALTPARALHRPAYARPRNVCEEDEQVML